MGYNDISFKASKYKIKNICVLEHFCLWVDEVISPILKQQENIQKFPLCIGKGQKAKSN